MLLSDKKKFRLDGLDCCHDYWRDLRKGPHHFSTRNLGRGSVVIWGAFSAMGQVDLAFVSTKISVSFTFQQNTAIIYLTWYCFLVNYYIYWLLLFLSYLLSGVVLRFFLNNSNLSFPYILSYLGRDRIWQNEERHRARLLRKQCSPSPIPEYHLILHRKPNRNKSIYSTITS
uniref:Uncharacterized protein n=1 Tax=Heterorhabditis bacteriophora TaxID=37862 RepID=A0A1I7XAW0_HETBA